MARFSARDTGRGKRHRGMFGSAIGRRSHWRTRHQSYCSPTTAGTLFPGLDLQFYAKPTIQSAIPPGAGSEKMRAWKFARAKNEPLVLQTAASIVTIRKQRPASASNDFGFVGRLFCRIPSRKRGGAVRAPSESRI